MTLDSMPVHLGFRGGHVCEAYNEAAFKHFLAVEHARARRSHRFLLLVVATIRRSPGKSATLSDPVAAALFRGLGASVREVDFVGWFREGHAAGAVLAQGAHTFDRAASSVIAQRVTAELDKQLFSADRENLRVRVTRLGGKAGVSHE
jgi:hypothetical protein